LTATGPDPDPADLSGVAVLEAQLVPQIESIGRLRIAGFFLIGADPGQLRTGLCAGEGVVAVVRRPDLARSGGASRTARVRTSALRAGTSGDSLWSERVAALLGKTARQTNCSLRVTGED